MTNRTSVRLRASVQSTELLQSKSTDMRIHCGLGFAKAFFWGMDFAKPRLLIFEIRRDFVLDFRAQEGSGEECTADFWRGLKAQIHYTKIVSDISLLVIVQI